MGLCQKTANRKVLCSPSLRRQRKPVPRDRKQPLAYPSSVRLLGSLVSVDPTISMFCPNFQTENNPRLEKCTAKSLFLCVQESSEGICCRVGSSSEWCRLLWWSYELRWCFLREKIESSPLRIFSSSPYEFECLFRSRTSRFGHLPSRISKFRHLKQTGRVIRETWDFKSVNKIFTRRIIDSVDFLRVLTENLRNLEATHHRIYQFHLQLL